MPRSGSGARTGPELTAFQALYDFAFDDFQRRACQALDGGHGVLVAAPTGSGKTVVGEFAVHLALAEGRKCFYTTPIKALSNQKYNDLVRRYGAGQVGLLTGDNSINGEAPVVVMTTEVLRNMLYAGSATLSGLGYVVLDEVHYLADRVPRRGLGRSDHPPARVGPGGRAVGHGEQRRGVRRLAGPGPRRDHGDRGRAPAGAAVAAHAGRRAALRPVHRVGPGNGTRPAADRGRATGPGPAGERRAQVNPELLRLARREDWAARKAPPGRPGAAGGRCASGRRAGRRSSSGWTAPGCCRRSPSSSAGRAATPRSGSAWTPGSRLTTPDEVAAITEIAERRTRDIPETDLPVLGYGEWLTGLQRGIAAHHAGMLPTFKEVVEELFEAGLVRAVFATETLALGINMPARHGRDRAAGQVERRDPRGADPGGVHPADRPGRPPRHRRGGARRGALAARAWTRWRWPGWPAPGPTR